MSTLGWLLVGGVLMNAVALSGSLTLLLRPATLERLMDRSRDRLGRRARRAVCGRATQLIERAPHGTPRAPLRADAAS